MSSPSNSNLEKIKAEETTLLDRTFRDSEGNIVIAQMPNLPLIVGLAAFVLQYILPIGKFQVGADLVAFGALFTWGWQELFKGVNYFRQALGLIVLVGIVALKLILY